MDISMTPQLEAFVNRKVASGEFGSASEVIQEALRLMDEFEKAEQQKLEELRREIQIGIDEADRGELLDAKEVLREIREDFGTARGRRKQ